MTMRQRARARPVTKSQHNRLAVAGGRLARSALRGVPVLGTALGVAETLGAFRGGPKPPTERGERKPPRTRAVFMKKGRVYVGYTAKEVKRALRRKAGGPTKVIPVKGAL